MQLSSDLGDLGRALLLVQDQSGPLSGAPSHLGDSEPLCADCTAALAPATILSSVCHLDEVLLMKTYYIQTKS